MQRPSLGPALPELPGSFDGPQIHSHDYVDPSTPLELHGKRVLVVGIGNSAVDIVSELGRKTICETVFLSTRSGAYVIPKYIFGKPADQIVKTNPRISVGCSVAWAGAAADLLRAHGGLRPADAQPQASSTPTRPSPASCSGVSAQATRSPRATCRS